MHNKILEEILTKKGLQTVWSEFLNLHHWDKIERNGDEDKKI